MLAAKLREANARAERVEAAQEEVEGRAMELQAELDSVRRAAAEAEARQEEAVRALQAELAELKSAAPATPEKGRSGNLEGVSVFDWKDSQCGSGWTMPLARLPTLQVVGVLTKSSRTWLSVSTFGLLDCQLESNFWRRTEQDGAVSHYFPKIGFHALNAHKESWPLNGQCMTQGTTQGKSCLPAF